MSEEQADKDCQTKTIGSMTGDESISASSVAVHDINHFLEIGMMRRAKPLKKRFKE